MINYIYRDKLKTDRLVTRWLTIEDIPAWADFFADKDVTEFFPNPDNNSNVERANHMISKQLDRYADKRFGLQALIDKKSNAFVGQCGLLAQEIAGITETEVGYHIFKKYRGQGFATEAAKLFINFAFENHLTNSVVSIIDIANIRSQRVALKNGLAVDKKIRWSGNEEVFIFRINKDN